jgi:hypothetical protein
LCRETQEKTRRRLANPVRQERANLDASGSGALLHRHVIGTGRQAHAKVRRRSRAHQIADARFALLRQSAQEAQRATPHAHLSIYPRILIDRDRNSSQGRSFHRALAIGWRHACAAAR